MLPARSGSPMLKFLLFSCFFPLPVWVSAQVSEPIPKQILECENPGDHCNQAEGGATALWQLNGGTGVGEWVFFGDVANLRVDGFDAHSVVIKRINSENSPTPGLTATHTGTRHGNLIDGTAAFSWPGHPETGSKEVAWHAAILESDVETRPATPCSPKFAAESGEFGGPAAHSSWLVGKRFAEDGNYEEAMKWYRRAASAGSAIAAYEVAQLYHTGYTLPSAHEGPITTARFAPADQPEAFRWYNIAAQRGYTRGMNMVAMFYFFGDKVNGSKVPSNNEQGMCWTNLSAERDDTVAQVALAYLNLQVLQSSTGQENKKQAFDTVRTQIDKLHRLNSRFKDQCSALKQEMSKQLPSPREIQVIDVVEVHGSAEFVCLATLEPLRQDDRDGLIDQLRGSRVPNWPYTIYELAGGSVSIKRMSFSDLFVQTSTGLTSAIDSIVATSSKLQRQ
jgi:hypothetical protein